MADYLKLSGPEETIFWKAAENPAILETMKNATDRLSAIKSLRELLIKTFPEISLLPARYTDGSRDEVGHIWLPQAADYWIAMALMEFREKQK